MDYVRILYIYIVEDFMYSGYLLLTLLFVFVVNDLYMLFPLALWFPESSGFPVY